MSRYVFKMPDLGEGTVSAEVVAWHVKPGDLVQEDQVMCEVMTEKAAVEMPAPVTGRIISISGEPGDMVAVGAELVVFDTDATSAAAGEAPAVKIPTPAPEPVNYGRRASDRSREKQPGEKQKIAEAANESTTNGTGTHKGGGRARSNYRGGHGPRRPHRAGRHRLRARGRGRTRRAAIDERARQRDARG